MGSSYAKIKYNIFYRKLDAKYFHIKQFFSEKNVISLKTAKNCFRSTFDHFLGKRNILHKKLILPFLSRIRYQIFYY